MGNPQEIQETDKAWLAGIIEGDGAIGMGFHEPTKSGRLIAAKPSVSFSNQDSLLIERVSALISRLSGKHPQIRENQPGGFQSSRTTMHVVLVGMEAVMRVLLSIEPYLVGNKGAKARLLTQFIASRLSKGINRKGYRGYQPYDKDELMIMKSFAEVKGGRNPRFLEILNDYTRDPLGG